MCRGDNMGHLTPAARRQQRTVQDTDHELDIDPLFIRFLRTLKEVLRFVLFSYTMLFGALLLARWTTYLTLGK